MIRYFELNSLFCFLLTLNLVKAKKVTWYLFFEIKMKFSIEKSDEGYFALKMKLKNFKI
jgi:hypothetical protein